MQKPLVSILIPFKNTELFLVECLDSIVNQTYTNWELIIVDDSSTDSSYNIVNAFAEKEHRIKLLENSGNGIIPALQRAFKHSKGEFITRMDSDDIMRPKKIEVLVNQLLNHGQKHVALGLVNYFSNEGIKAGYKSYETWLNLLTKNGTNYSEIYKECVIPSPCWMIHREDFIDSDAFNPNRYPEDYDLAFRFYKQGYRCIPCNTVVHDWRDYSTRTSRTHQHYAENHFIDLKIHYFLELDHDPNKKLVVWGAGRKGKKVAKSLLEKKIAFEWVCDNPKKIGKDIYGTILKPFDFLANVSVSQSIITVANKEAQHDIIEYMNRLNMKPIDNYVFFC